MMGENRVAITGVGVYGVEQIAIRDAGARWFGVYGEVSGGTADVGEVSSAV